MQQYPLKQQSKTEAISLDFMANGNFEPIQELTFLQKIWKSNQCFSKRR
jgi:hypothetical protein